MRKKMWSRIIVVVALLAYGALTFVNVNTFNSADSVRVDTPEIVSDNENISKNELISGNNPPLASLNELGGVSLSGIQIPDELIPESAFPSTGVMLNVLDFGAVGDGRTDDTKAFREAVAAAREYDTVYAPNPAKEYILTDTIEINKNIHFVIDGGLAYKGPKDRTVISTANLLRCKFSVNYVRDGNGTMDQGAPWGGYHGFENDQYTGVMMTNSKWTSVSIGYVANFTNGVVCRAGVPGSTSGGFWFNNINITEIRDCLIGLELRSKTKGSWVNSNVFYNTSFAVTSEPGFRSNGHQYISILQSCSSDSHAAEANLFYNLRFEVSGALTNGTTYTAIYLHRAANWAFINYRTELASSGVTFCAIDCAGLTEVVSRSGITNGLTFIPIDPLNPKALPGEKIKIINAENVNIPCSVDEIYQYSTTKWYMMEQNNALRGDMMRVQTYYFIMRGYSFVHFGRNGGESLLSTMTSKTLAKESELNIESSDMLAFTMIPSRKHATMVINLSGSYPIFDVFCYRKDGSLITSEYDSKGVRLIAMDGFFSSITKAFAKNTSSSRPSFSILSDEVAYVTVGIFGSVSGYSIVSDDPDLQILRYRENTHLNSYREFFSAQAPTSVDAPIDSRVFDANNTNRFWQLIEEAGKKKWIYK